MIIDFRKEKIKRAKPLASYHVRIDLYDDGIAGAVLDLGDDLEPSVARGVADNLVTMSRFIREIAFEQDGNEDHKLIAITQIFKSSRVWTYCSNEIQEKQELEWMDRRYDDAKEGIRQGLDGQGL